MLIGGTAVRCLRFMKISVDLLLAVRCCCSWVSKCHHEYGLYRVVHAGCSCNGTIKSTIDSNTRWDEASFLSFWGQCGVERTHAKQALPLGSMAHRTSFLDVDGTHIVTKLPRRSYWRHGVMIA